MRAAAEALKVAAGGVVLFEDGGRMGRLSCELDIVNDVACSGCDAAALNASLQRMICR